MRISFLTVIFVILTSLTALAGSKQLLTVEGTIFDSAATTPVTHTDVVFMSQIVAPNGCVLWQEAFSAMDLSNSKGGFVLTIGSGANSASGALTWDKIFKNGYTLSSLAGSGCPGSYTGASSDDRTLYITFSATTPSVIALQTVPAIPIKANAQNAMIAGIPFNGTPNTNDYIMFNGTDWVASPVTSGVTSITGTANQVTASAATGAVTLSLPQNIHTAASPTFSSMTLSSMAAAGIVKNSAGGVLLGGNSVSLSTSDVSGILPIANGGTGSSTANAAFNALVPSQTGNSGKYLTTDGSNTSWSTVAGAGTVTSVTSANTDMSIATTTTTPVITLNSGVTGGAGDANKITKLDASGLLNLGMLPTVTVAKGGTGLSATSLGSILMGSGTSTWTTFSCPTGQILLWGAAGSTSCVNLPAGGTPAGADKQIQFNNAGAFGANTNFVWDNTNSRMGIGTASPSNTLDVQGSVTSGTLNAVSNVTGTISSNMNVAFKSTAKPGSNSQSQFAAIYGTVDFSAYPTYNWAANDGAVGIIGEIIFSKTDTNNVGGLQGISGSVLVDTGGYIQNGNGISAKVTAGKSGVSSGSMNSAAALDASVTTEYTGSTIATATGIMARVNSVAGSTITNAKGLDININGAGSFTNSYGIYISNLPSSGSKWSLYSSDSNAPSYFAANVGIGVPSPLMKLDVSGGIKVGNDATSCTGAISGSIRYNASTMEYCNGSAWSSLGGGGISGSGASGYISRFTASSTIASSSLWDTGTKVGIGTVAPQEHFVAHSTNGTGTSLTVSTPGTTTTQQAMINLITSTNAAGSQTYASAGTKGWQIYANGNSYSTNPNALGFTLWDGSTWYNPLYLSATGNVGINNTSPTATLDIIGSTKITGQLTLGSAGNPIVNMGVCTQTATPTFAGSNVSNTTTQSGTINCTGATTAANVNCTPNNDPAFSTCFWKARVTAASTITITLLNTNSTSQACYAANPTWTCKVAW